MTNEELQEMKNRVESTFKDEDTPMDLKLESHYAAHIFTNDLPTLQIMSMSIESVYRMAYLHGLRAGRK